MVSTIAKLQNISHQLRYTKVNVALTVVIMALPENRIRLLSVYSMLLFVHPDP